jgi:putative heme-binding domain-containing protein
LLAEKPSLSEDTLKNLEAMVKDPSVDAAGLNPAAIHAIWVLSAHGKWQGGPLLDAIKHPSDAVVRNAIQASEPNAQTLQAILDSRALDSQDPQLKLAALLKIADCPSQAVSTGSKSIGERLGNRELDRKTTGEEDRWLMDAWTSAASAHAAEVLPRLVRDAQWSASSEKLQRIAIVAEHAARNKISAEAFASLIVEKANPQVTGAVIQGLAKGWPKDYRLALPETATQGLVKHWLSGDLPLDSKGQVIQLAEALGVAKIDEAIASLRKELVDILNKDSLGIDQRLLAAKQMVTLEVGSAKVVDSLLGLVTPQSMPEFSAGIVGALGGSKAPGLAKALIEKSKSLPPEFLRGGLRVMLSRPESTKDLIAAIEAGDLSINDLQLDQRQLLRDHPDTKIREKALAMMKSSGGIPNADRQRVVEAWEETAHSKGDGANGKLVYQKHCALCHKHGDLGNQIGPELTGMAVHPKHELLIHILDPNRSVEGNYRTYNVQTTDGSVVTGMMAGESKTSIELVNVQGKREVVLREDIERLSGSQKSLMPEGFESQMNRDEMRDLLEFLTTKGKYVPLSIATVATSITTRGMFFDPDGQVERLVFPDWKPKMFKGVPFVLIDPQDDRVANAIMLYGPNGKMAPKMPKSIDVVCNAPAVAIHFLSGVGGWSFPATREGSVSMTVRITYEDGKTEDHDLINGEHFADYIRRVDVPKSEFAFDLDGRQIRYLSIQPKERKAMQKISLIKGRDASAPVVMAITLQTQ